MKKIHIIAVIITAAFSSLLAQGPADAFLYSQQNTTGTARYMGMSGAFGALGGDFSTLSSNPAGIGVYRTSEFVFTSGFTINTNLSNTMGFESSDRNSNINIGNIGYVGTWRSAKSTGLVSLSWGVGFNRIQDYNRNSYYQNYGNTSSSLTDVMAREATNNNLTPGDFGSDNIWGKTSWRSVLGWDSFLFNYYDGDGVFSSILLPDQEEAPTTPVNQFVNIAESGRVNEWAFSFGGNVSHMLYFGATLGIQSIYYKKETRFAETFENEWYQAEDGYYSYRQYDLYNGDKVYFSDGGFEHNERLKTVGTGINFKAGLIFRPFSFLRLGVAAHTPTFYNLRDYYYQNLYPDVMYAESAENGAILDDLAPASESPDGEFNYRLQTPFKAMGSAALVFGKFGLISLDYEMTNYSMMTLSSRSGSTYDFVGENEDISDIYGISHGLRAGVELSITRFFKLRGGAGYATSPLNEDPYNEYIVDRYGDLYTLSGGFGFRTQGFFMDLAYMYRTQEFDHYLYGYQDTSNPQNLFYDVKTTNTLQNHFVNLTLGFKF